MTRLQQQLTLNVQLRDDATIDNFLWSEQNLALRGAMQSQFGVGGEPIIYVYGASDTGKTHLLQAGCHLAKAASALYLPLLELADIDPQDVLQGVEHMGLVCLDDVQAVMGNEAWEDALFHFFNRARAENCRLLVSADTAPRALAAQLPDLRSRLSWGIVYQLSAGGDDQRKAILRFRAAKRGMSLSDEVASYIIDRAPRAQAMLIALLDQLDKASLEERRALSIPFVKKALNW